jgi:hypothetical protein
MEDEQSRMGSLCTAKQILFIAWACVPLELITALDQPNRVVRTRMLCGVGGDSCEAIPYPDVCRAGPAANWCCGGILTQIPCKVHIQADGAEG